MIDGVTMNIVTPIELIQKVVDHMISQKFGRIVNITSMSVKMPVPGLDLSSGARAGLTAFLAGVSRTIADNNVTVNSILPGFFDTDRLRGGLESWAKNTGVSVQEVADDRASKIPAKRFGTPDEFGKACAFLCSAHAGYITGQSLMIDGGVYNSAF
jgi:3-oxoacyl-[acyl-carrier protein] reductase